MAASGTSVDRLEQLETGDRVLYNDKQQPLTVVEPGEEKVLIEGPQGGEYVLFYPPDHESLLLVAKPGHREYASKVTDLRTAGKWVQEDEDTWRHTGSGAELRVEQTEAGYWTLNTDDFDGGDLDLPFYGYTDREMAEGEARKLMERYPEG